MSGSGMLIWLLHGRTGYKRHYLSTAAKWGIGKHDALRDLFNGHAWIPPALEPAA
jgi:hypothetical protein